ncbi:MAG: biotin/lipoyl-binding protein, partial [Pseudomonadales bacterium]|nr:biotin/lipoyl-binding protein [Pseudomonadales bacterium]
MSLKHLLIANRGEIAIRIARAANDLGIEVTTIYSDDDAASLHTRAGDNAVSLGASGIAAYLDGDRIVEIAAQAGCDAVHPGYGFLSESAEFAVSCIEKGVRFVGPHPDMLEALGNKGKARQIAREAGVPVLAGTDGATGLEEAKRFFDELDGGAMIIKAISGGGGRGTRLVKKADELEEAYRRCSSEAMTAFGNGDLYVEQLIERARHIEVQIVGDGEHVVHLGERDCSVQRRHQKVIEIAPAPSLDESTRDAICSAAVDIARKVGYSSLGTFEFLVDVASKDFVFIEANARLQVEHTVTEEVTGVDLVQAQLELAGGKTLEGLGLSHPPERKGFAIQARVNLESIDRDGSFMPSGGTLTAYDVPSGPGIRVDGFGYTGYATNGNYDSLLAKLICHADGPFEASIRRTLRALSEFRVEGVETNISFLESVIDHPDFSGGNITTRWVDLMLQDLVASDRHPRRYISQEGRDDSAGFAGAQIDHTDPLALFDYDRSVKAQQTRPAAAKTEGPGGSVGIPAPIQGTIISVEVSEGDPVHRGQTLLIMEAMKMEHEIKADRDGFIRKVGVKKGSVISSGHALVFIEEADVDGEAVSDAEQFDPDFIRPDLQEKINGHAYTLDENRPK